jgi:hypothetical protein
MAFDPGKMRHALQWLISHGPDRTSALAQVAVTFAAAPPERVAELLETPITLCKTRQTAEGRFVGSRSEVNFNY